MRFRGSTLKTYLTRIFLVSLIVAFLLPFLITQAQCEISYIVVHAVNPEGIEIASIEGMNLYSVPIFDGDKLIGFSGHDAETTNRVIKISPGTHTIRAIFNGITKEQTVTLIPNEIRTITFTFDRNNFDLAGYFDSIGGSFVDISQEATWVTGDNQWVDEISPDPFNAGIWLWVEAWKLNQERPMTFSWKANGESNIILNSTQFKIRTKAKVEITDKANCEGSIRVSAFLDNYELGFSCGLSSTTDFTRWFVQYIQDGWWPRVFLQNSLFMWGIMTGYRGLPDGTQVPDEGYHFVTLPAYIDYTDISFFLYRDYSKEWIYWNHRVGVSAWVDGVGSDSDELSYEGKLHNLKCSSIPYDITGKGIKAGEGNPPAPSSALTLSVPCGIKVHVAGSTSPYAVYGGNVAPQDINMAFDIASSPERHGYRFLGSATSTQEFYGSFVWYLVVATGGVNVDAFEFLIKLPNCFGRNMAECPFYLEEKFMPGQKSLDTVVEYCKSNNNTEAKIKISVNSSLIKSLQVKCWADEAKGGNELQAEPNQIEVIENKKNYWVECRGKKANKLIVEVYPVYNLEGTALIQTSKKETESTEEIKINQPYLPVQVQLQSYTPLPLKPGTYPVDIYLIGNIQELKEFTIFSLAAMHIECEDFTKTQNKILLNSLTKQDLLKYKIGEKKYKWSCSLTVEEPEKEIEQTALIFKVKAAVKKEVTKKCFKI